MRHLALLTTAAMLLAACTVDLVLPQDQNRTEGVTVIDLNARTQNRAVVNGQ